MPMWHRNTSCSTWQLYDRDDTNNNCISTNMLVKLIFQDNIGQKSGLFRTNSQFQDFYRPDFFFIFRTRVYILKCIMWHWPRPLTSYGPTVGLQKLWCTVVLRLDVDNLYTSDISIFTYYECIVTGAVWCTAPIRNSLVQFAKLHLSTVVKFSSAMWTNKSLIGAAHCSKPCGIVFCSGTLDAPARSAISTSRLVQPFAGHTLVTNRHTTLHVKQ